MTRNRNFFITAIVWCLMLWPVTASFALELTAPSNYTKDVLIVGSKYYLDRDYTITSQPAGFDTYAVILTRNDDKDETASEHIVFTLADSATVYVAYDSRAGSRPCWMNGFSSTGQNIETTDVTLNLYSKDYAAGTVTLGGNKTCGGSCDSDCGADSNYIVYVQESTELSVDPDTLTMAPGDAFTATISGGTAPYTVADSNATAATSSITDNNIVTVTGVAEGTSTVTVTDHAGDSVTIDVTVMTALSVSPSTLQLIEGGIGTVTVTGGSGTYTIGNNSNASAATATIDGDVVTVEAQSQGSATITIEDGFSSVNISVDVYPPLSVDPATLNMNENETGTVTVSGGAQPYTVLSGNSSIATASISGSTVTVQSITVGSISVTITDSASNSITVQVNVGGSVAEGLESCPLPPFLTGETVTPNILIILDHSGSMGNGSGSKWETAKEVVINLIDDNPNVRFGLMRMDGSNYTGNDHWYDSAKIVRQGGKVLKPCGTDHDEITTYINNWASSNDPQTWTNLGETLASAGQYFATVEVGGNRTGKGPTGLGYYEKEYRYEWPSGSGSTYDATVTDDKGNTIGSTSPIQYYCQKSFIIFISDGLANYDNDWDVVTDTIGDHDGDADPDDCKEGDDGCASQGEYFDDVAKYLYDNDMRSDLDGDQNITTYVVGFQIDDTLLSNAAEQGGGEYYTANDFDGLTTALQSAVEDILDKISSGTAVSTIATSSQSDDYLIRAKFLPQSWKGYLEAYTLPYTEGDTAVWEAGDILSETFSNTDGIGRNIYTYMGGETPSKQDFTSSNTALVEDLGLQWADASPWDNTKDLIEYIRGDSTNEGTDPGEFRERGGWLLGDIIYSTPVSVGPPEFYYDENDYHIFKTDNEDRDTMVYVGANDGMLHAFRANDAETGCPGTACAGSEAWAFIPENIRANLDDLAAEGCHNYYVDLTPYVTDIWDGTEWKTVLIGGNRLGGDEYFCLDITDPAHDQFSVIWNIVPFSNKKSSTMPFVGKIQANQGTTDEVDKWLTVITSGYHEGTGDGEIAAFNFTDGSKETIWNDGTSDVNVLTTQSKDALNPYYTLSSPNGLDSDEDGYIDLIFAGDTEGTLWKFYYDFQDNVWKKTVFFQATGQAITVKPDLVFDEYGQLRIYFGTGKYMVGSDKYNETWNTFYCIIDSPVDLGDTDPNDGHFTNTTATVKSDLVDLTDVTTSEGFYGQSETTQDTVYKTGWYIALDEPNGPGERILEKAITISKVVFFTSFIPNSDVCGYGGDSRLYAIDFKTGLQAKNEGTSVLEGMSENDRYKALGPGLPSEPVFYFDPVAKQPKLIIQTSETTVYEEDINISDNPMDILSWKKE